MEQVKLLSMTVVLTVLVWAAADSLVNETVSIDVTLEVVPDTAVPPMLIELVDPETGSLELEISGPRKIVEDVQRAPPQSARLRVPDRPTGSHVLPLDKESLERELAQQSNEFTRLRVVSVQPTALTLNVDHLVTRDVSIALNRLTLAYDVKPQPDRTSTTVRMRESEYNRLAQAGEPLQLDISAEVDRLFRKRTAGQTATIPLTLSASSFGVDAELVGDTLSISATVKAQRREVPAVPVLLAVSFPNLEKPYRAVARDGGPLHIVAPSITVAGPTEDVERLVNGVTRAYGIIRLKEAHLEELGVIKLETPEYLLPPRVELAEPAQPVEFKLIDASRAEPEG